MTCSSSQQVNYVSFKWSMLFFLSYLNLLNYFLAPTGPPRGFLSTPGARNMTFSWSPPAPSLRNGVITSYSLSCVSEGGRNSISNQYTAAGTFTLGGFTPATSYNCSISARNSQGSGPATHRVVTTLDDGIYHI